MKKAALGFISVKCSFVRDQSVGVVRSEKVVWEYPILTLSMAALVKSAALQNVGRCTCEEMLRQQ